jgi:hypothetical protein
VPHSRSAFWSSACCYLRAVSCLPSCSLRVATMRNKTFRCAQGCKNEPTGKLKQCLGEQVGTLPGDCSGDLAIFGHGQPLDKRRRSLQRPKWNKSKQGEICARKAVSTRKPHSNPILRAMNFSPNQGWIRNRPFGNPPNWIIVISWHVGGFPDKVGSVDKHWLCTSVHHMYRMGLLHLLISFLPASYLARGN